MSAQDREKVGACPGVFYSGVLPLGNRDAELAHATVDSRQKSSPKVPPSLRDVLLSALLSVVTCGVLYVVVLVLEP